MILHLPIEPIGCPRPRATIRGGHAGVYMPSSYRKWQEEASTLIYRAALAAGMSDFQRIALSGEGARISVEAVFPRIKSLPKKGGRVRFRRYDADNVLKACMDALQVAIRERMGATAWDDKKMEIGGIERWYAAVNEDAHIRVILEKANK